MELDYKSIGKRIILRRKKLKIQQVDLAEQIGISNTYLSSIEHGKEKPSLDILVRICNGLSVTPDYLCTPITSPKTSLIAFACVRAEILT